MSTTWTSRSLLPSHGAGEAGTANARVCVFKSPMAGVAPEDDEGAFPVRDVNASSRQQWYHGGEESCCFVGSVMFRRG